MVAQHNSRTFSSCQTETLYPWRNTPWVSATQAGPPASCVVSMTLATLEASFGATDSSPYNSCDGFFALEGHGSGGK